jgi:hypothetical protein
VEGNGIRNLYGDTEERKKSAFRKVGVPMVIRTEYLQDTSEKSYHLN